MPQSTDFRDFVERVREATDIVEVISEHLTLRRRGQRFFGLCPFHDERTPSFSVSPDKQLFYCFGCHEGGDVFDFVMKKEGYDFKETLEVLARRAGLPMPDTEQTPAEQRRSRERRELLKALDLAARYYQYVLLKTPGAAEARSYLERRGVTAEMIERFGLGYAPGGWSALLDALRKRGHRPEMLERAGLVSARREGSGYYDRFRDRVMFPIRDQSGRVIAFGGRIIGNGEPKYLNSPETSVFSKRHTWYALDIAKENIRRQDRAVVMEGYMDVLTAHQYGFGEAVASLGTALTPEQAKRLVRFSSSVIICYDADTAGNQATLRGLELFEELGATVRVVRLPQGRDPDDVLRGDGPEKFSELLEESRPLIEYQFEVALENADTGTIEGRVAVVAAVAPWLARLDNAVAQTSYIRRFAERLQVQEQALRQEVAKHRQRGVQQTPAASLRHRTAARRDNITVISEKSGITTQKRDVPGYIKAEWALIGLMLRSKSYTTRIRELLSEDDFFLPETGRIVGVIYRYVDDHHALPEPGELIRLFDDNDVRQRVSELLMTEQVLEDPERVLSDCVEQIRRRKVLQRLENVRKQIMEQERSGSPVSRPLLQEYDNLNRILKGKPQATDSF